MTEKPCPDELNPCPFCGKECRVEDFAGEHIEGDARLWICSNNKYFGGWCVDENAYLSESAWNTRLSGDEVAMRAALEQMVAEKCDYMRINNLGDPETQHTIKQARAALSALPTRACDGVGPLVEFFRGPGFSRFGHEGDYNGWSTEQTAVHFLTEYLNISPKEWPIPPPPGEGARGDLREAALKLLNELEGLLVGFEDGLREVFGNTNFTILKQRTAEARAALSPSIRED